MDCVETAAIVGHDGWLTVIGGAATVLYIAARILVAIYEIIKSYRE